MNREKILEKDFQDNVFTDKTICKNIIEVLGLAHNSIFIREVEFINGITSDFIVYDENQTLGAIIECKRADIGVTEYVRGVGQLFQYEYFQEEGISPRKFAEIKYDEKIKNNILLIPSGFIRNTKLNIGRFRYPNSAKILEVHEKNKNVRQVSKEELSKLALSEDKKVHTICQYYVRDIRLFEVYILHQLLSALAIMSIKRTRQVIEQDLLREISVINNKNWRNAFITLSSLGFIGNENRPLGLSSSLVHLSVIEYINTLYEEYIYPFVDEIMQVLVDNAKENKVSMNNQAIAKEIRRRHNGFDVLYLTDSNGRYISSWLNLMRDDLGCISFEARSPERTINYEPKILNQRERVNQIEKYSKATEYIEAYNKIKNKIIQKLL